VYKPGIKADMTTFHFDSHSFGFILVRTEASLWSNIISPRPRVFSFHNHNIIEMEDRDFRKIERDGSLSE